MNNIFEEFQQKKKYIETLAMQAAEYNWITKKQSEEIIKKLESDILTIGVIGQIKCGKSTFLNAFVFEDDILPAATTPMTASLSIITYGEEKKVVAEFYTKDEWAEQKLTAARDVSEVEGDDLEVAKIKAAKELVEKSDKLGNSLEKLLGKTQNDSFESLLEYVGVDGKYVSITKSVHIYYPKEYLKGVEIVDTPGMNDPIVSREERTKEFLNKADVVLMMIYAGRPFDATDHTILFENVRKCGIGKVLIGINKYDIPYMNGDSEEDIKNYVENEIYKACTQLKDDTISDILKEVDPVLISANMALLSELPMTKITNSEIYNFDWKRYCDKFEISSQKQFKETSHIEELSKKVIDLIEKEKGQILFAKPKNQILAAGTNKKADIEKQLFEAQNELNILLTPNDELDEKLEDLSKANTKMTKKLNRLSENLEDILYEKNYIPKMKRDLEDIVDDACNKMKRAVDDWRLSEKFEKIRVDLERYLKRLTKRDLPRAIEDDTKKIKDVLKSEIQEYFSDIHDLAGRYISDFDLKDFFEVLRLKVELTAEEEIDSYNIGDVFSKSGDFWSSLTNGWIFTRNSNKEQIKEKIIQISASFSPQSFVNFIHNKKESIVSNIKKETIDELLDPINKAIQDCKSDIFSREKRITELQATIQNLEKTKKQITEQIQKISTF